MGGCFWSPLMDWRCSLFARSSSRISRNNVATFSLSLLADAATSAEFRPINCTAVGIRAASGWYSRFIAQTIRLKACGFFKPEIVNSCRDWSLLAVSTWTAYNVLGTQKHVPAGSDTSQSVILSNGTWIKKKVIYYTHIGQKYNHDYFKSA